MIEADEVLRVLGILEERVGPIEDGDDDDDQTPMALLTRIEHMCYGENPEGDHQPTDASLPTAASK